LFFQKQEKNSMFRKKKKRPALTIIKQKEVGFILGSSGSLLGGDKLTTGAPASGKH
jgi:hypothetical protein